MRYYMTDFRKNLRRVRKAKGLTQQKLSLMLDMSDCTIRRLESDLGNPTLLTLFTLCEALDCSITDLVGGVEHGEV